MTVSRNYHLFILSLPGVSWLFPALLEVKLLCISEHTKSTHTHSPRCRDPQIYVKKASVENWDLGVPHQGDAGAETACSRAKGAAGTAPVTRDTGGPTSSSPELGKLEIP